MTLKLYFVGLENKHIGTGFVEIWLMLEHVCVCMCVFVKERQKEREERAKDLKNKNKNATNQVSITSNTTD
jgi:hypothetical protein